MRIPTSLLFLVLLCSSSLGQFENKLTAKPVEAILAPSVVVEQLTDEVAVFLPEKSLKAAGIEIEFTTNAKFASILVLNSKGVPFTANKSTRPNIWLVFAPPGSYTVIAAPNDPEKGMQFVPAQVVIPGVVEEPDKPPTDPPSGDYAAITKVARESADKLNDEPTRLALANAYTTALNQTQGKDYEQTQATIRAARRFVLSARKGTSRAVNWDVWLSNIDAEFAKAVKAGDVESYRDAVEAVVIGLTK